MSLSVPQVKGLDMYTLYGLLNDALELVYIGCTASPERRRKDHVADFRGVHDLRMIIGTFDTLADAQRTEKSIVRELSQSSDLLINVNYNIGRFDEYRKLIRKCRSCQHRGRQEWGRHYLNLVSNRSERREAIDSDREDIGAPLASHLATGNLAATGS
jgi:hypothetical protein